MTPRDLDIISLQRADHARMEELLRSYESAVAEPDARSAYARIVHLVTRHAFAEETVLFPAARRFFDAADPLTADIEAKHQLINDLMVEMQRLEPGDPAFEARRERLFTLLRSDAREEEDVLLAALAQRTTPRQRRAIGASWGLVRLAGPTRPHPRVSRRPPGNLLAGLPLAISDRLQGLWQRMRTSAG